jgi:antitoxin component YwqK of YwqJK toxin-antitoxin module
VQSMQAGELHGLTRKYNPAGELVVEKTFDHDDVTGYRGPGPATAPWLTLTNQAGPMKTTFANGKPAFDATYLHDEYTGTVTAYYSSGEVFSRMRYEKGERTGLSESFYPGGKLLEQENFLRGEQHGRSRYFRPDGSLEREETYLCGELAGPTTYFDAAGKPLRTDVFWNVMVYDKK